MYLEVSNTTFLNKYVPLINMYIYDFSSYPLAFSRLIEAAVIQESFVQNTPRPCQLLFFTKYKYLLSYHFIAYIDYITCKINTIEECKQTPCQTGPHTHVLPPVGVHVQVVGISEIENIFPNLTFLDEPEGKAGVSILFHISHSNDQWPPVRPRRLSTYRERLPFCRLRTMKYVPLYY